ncbi:MAG: hypothetical protein BZ138_05095 [Methanosphaera sp. rholeuAM270]|nr:MAG: hypothetical protein BZ138_05095 [Methanosphaera sp. rholeuAM270]
MKISIDGVRADFINNGIMFEFETPFYVLANRDGFDFKYLKKFDNHYANKANLERVLVQENGISVVSTVEFFEDKYFTNISIFLDANLDNITLLNIFRVVTESISTVAYQKGAFNRDELSNQLGNYYNMVYVSCRDKSEKIISFDISLYYEVKELVSKALEKSFDYII